MKKFIEWLKSRAAVVRHLTVSYHLPYLPSRAAVTSKVVSVVIGLLILAILFPIAMTQVVTANTSGWNSAVSTVFTILVPVLAIIGVAYLFYKEAEF